MSRQYLPLNHDPRYLIERVNAFVALAEISAANGGADFVGKPERMAASVVSTLPPSQKIKQLLFCKFRELILGCCAYAPNQGFMFR